MKKEIGEGIIFYTRVLCGGKVWNVIIYGGSTENVLSKQGVDKLKLPVEKHPNPYKIYWLRKGNEIPATSCCLVHFTLGSNLVEAICDVVPMDASHSLLGRQWLYEHEMDRHIEPNTYSFFKRGKQYTLHPLKEEIGGTSSNKLNGPRQNLRLRARQLGLCMLFLGRLLRLTRFQELMIISLKFSCC